MGIGERGSGKGREGSGKLGEGIEDLERVERGFAITSSVTCSVKFRIGDRGERSGKWGERIWKWWIA